MRLIELSFVTALVATLPACGGGARQAAGAGGHTSGTGGGGGGTGSGGGACSAAAAQGLAVAPSDVYGGAPYALGYPPYAIDGCSLAYVKPSGDLVLRDLASSVETVLEPASAEPRRPAIAGGLVAWEATLAGKGTLRVRGPNGVTSVSGAFDHAGEPRVAADSVVFTGWLGPMDLADTDVFLYTPSTAALVAVATGPGQQRFADVSSTHVAWSDFSEGANGVFSADGNDAANIVVLDRATQKVAVRDEPGKQAFPMLGAEGKLAYLDWGLVHPEPKFSTYDLKIGDVGGALAQDALVEHITAQIPYIRPIARGGYVEWVSLTNGPALKRQAVDLLTPATVVSSFMGVSVFGPSASDAITLIATTTPTAAVTLRAFAR